MQKQQKINKLYILKRYFKFLELQWFLLYWYFVFVLVVLLYLAITPICIIFLRIIKYCPLQTISLAWICETFATETCNENGRVMADPTETVGG